MVAKARQALKKRRKRNVEDALSYAVAHGIRIDILCYLNEQPHSPSGLTRLMGLPLSTVEHHIKELLASNSIELDHIKRVRNTTEHFYRAIEMPFYTDDEMWALPQVTRQEIYGMILQASTAELLASFRAEKISSDRRAWMAWRWFNLDSKGRDDMSNENERSWRRRLEIEAESAERCAETGEKPESIVVTLFTFLRCRNMGRPQRDPSNWP